MKKQIKLWILLSFLMSVFSVLGCGGNDHNSNSGDTVTIKVYNADSTKDWILYAWAKESQTQYCGSWPGSVKLTQKDSNGCLYASISINKNETLGVIFNDGNGTQTSDAFVSTEILAEYDTLYFIYGDTKVYLSFAEMAGLNSAQITSLDGNSISVKYLGKDTLAASNFIVKDKNGNNLTVSSLAGTNPNLVLTLADGNISKSPYMVKFNDSTVYALPKSEFIDSTFSDLNQNYGVSYTDLSSVTFKTWAPLSTSVSLLLFTDSTKVSSTPDSIIKMTSGEKGLWYLNDIDCSTFKYYKYRFETADSTYEVSDIWSFAASADSVASQIVNINDGISAVYNEATETYDGTVASYTNPFSGAYSDAVIYEMHIRDWSRAVVTDSTGKFLDIANSEKIISYLKELGITHVQILPMFDYAQTNADLNYNWGYNPYHYNVPEGRYVTDMVDGTDAVKQMRYMIEAFHKAGIAVNMDVVYNHTNGIGLNSLYDMTVPEYFYRVKSDGTYSNGSGCGNEIATNHAMVKKYVIESLKHWMLDYHINGFRFDLMGCLEADTMKEIYDELYQIDPSVMVYGEPWTGGDSSVTDGSKGAGLGTFGVGYGAFDDDFRDSIKGAEFGGFKLGQVQSNYSDSGIIKGLTGISGSNNRNTTGIPGLAIHYAECHDNFTLVDKLLISLSSNIDNDKIASYWQSYESLPKSSTKELIRKEDILAGSYVILSQGTPFINGGQEFLRTKKGNPDSYAADKKGGITWTSRYNGGSYVASTDIDDVNTIDLSFKTTYSDVYNTYKGLIALRKANSAAFGANTSATAEVYNSTAGVTKYVTGDFLVYFNATSAAVDISTTGYTKLVDVSSGTPTESTTLPASVAAKSFVILKK